MSTDRRFDLWGAAAGAALGLGDTALLVGLGVDMQVAGRDASLLVGLVFAFNLALVGGLAGALLRARRRERAAATELAATRQEVFENEKLAAIGRLAAGIAHEVRNPLGVMRASAAMVQEQFAPEADAHRACSFVVDEADRLNGLITALLAFARPSHVEPTEADLEPLVDRALALARPGLDVRRVEVSAELAPLAPSRVRVDPDLISQVLLCLVTNASEADGTRHIQLRGHRDPEGWSIRVADDGPGVAEQDRGHLFEPFFTTKARGTGLGLAMAGQIARAHGGTLRFLEGAGAGPNGRGACFELRLPWQLPRERAAA